MAGAKTSILMTVTRASESISTLTAVNESTSTPIQRSFFFKVYIHPDGTQAVLSILFYVYVTIRYFDWVPVRLKKLV